jgi:hypothetical protein
MKLLKIIKSFFIIAKGTYSNTAAMNLSYKELRKAIKRVKSPLINRRIE